MSARRWLTGWRMPLALAMLAVVASGMGSASAQTAPSTASVPQARGRPVVERHGRGIRRSPQAG